LIYIILIVNSGFWIAYFILSCSMWTFIEFSWCVVLFLYGVDIYELHTHSDILIKRKLCESYIWQWKCSNSMDYISCTYSNCILIRLSYALTLSTHLLLVPWLSMGRSVPLLPQSAYIACCETALCFCFHFVPVIDCWVIYTAWLHCNSVCDDISKLNSLNLLKPIVTYHLL
jgi:hypothetical protein